MFFTPIQTIKKVLLHCMDWKWR